MTRRAFCASLVAGEVSLDPTQSHHVRDVLRLQTGHTLELFDAAGRTATATIVSLSPVVVARVERVHAGAGVRMLTIASAVPKGERADWLVEKLSEIGVAAWQPLRTARSVVHPDGVSKYDRWNRLAVESAKQSRRSGVMRVEPMRSLEAFLQAMEGEAAVASTRVAALPMTPWIAAREPGKPLAVLVGPEGGWTDDELARCGEAGCAAVSLTRSILRLETAAVVAAGLVLAGEA